MAGCYYDGAGNNTNCYELYNKTSLSPDIDLINNIVEQTINSMGQHVNYYVNTYNTLSADNIYGEQPTSIYNGPHDLMIYIKLSENAFTLSKFGFSSEDEVTGYVSINGYLSAFNGKNVYPNLVQEVVPKSGDVFQMVEYGNDRYGNRGGNFFEVTERTDQDNAELNPLGGHYMWRLKAKRMDYSWQPGLTGERGNEQVYDDTFSGILSSTITGQLSSDPKSYDYDVNNISQTVVFDMSINNTSVYGDY